MRIDQEHGQKRFWLWYASLQLGWPRPGRKNQQPPLNIAGLPAQVFVPGVLAHEAGASWSASARIQSAFRWPWDARTVESQDRPPSEHTALQLCPNAP